MSTIHSCPSPFPPRPLPQLAQEYGPNPSTPAPASNTTTASPAAASPAPRVSIDPRVAAHLAQAYGGRAGRVLAVAEDSGLGKPLVEGQPVLEAEVGRAGCVPV